MYPPRFADCIVSNSPGWNFVESYFYLDGISNKSGWKKYQENKINRGIHYLSPISAGQAKRHLITAIKIVSLFTIIFPLLMLAAKYYYRSENHFVIGKVPPGSDPGNPAIPENINPIRQRPIPKFGATKPFGNMDTNIARNFASVRVEPDFVLNDAMHFFKARKNQRVADLPHDAVQEFLRRHAAEGRLQILPTTTLEELARKIAALKTDGVEGYKSYQAMLDIIDTLMAHAPYKDPVSKEGQLLRTLRARIAELPKDRQVLDQMMIYVERRDFARVERLADALADKIIADAKRPEFQTVGRFIEAGWRRATGGHRINVELLQVNGKWQFIVGQAGMGVQHHRYAYKRDHNQQPVVMDEKRVVPIKIYEVATEAEARALAKRIVLYKRGPESTQPGNGTEARGFYQLFKDAKVLDAHNIPFRTSQSMGNCALRSQQESFFYVCQRLAQVDIANDFQNILQEKIAHNAYPALKAQIAAQGPKETIKPLVDAPIKLRFSDPTGNAEHVLPLQERSRYVIGRMGDIALPEVANKFSREQAEIFQKEGKVYIAKHRFGSTAVSVVRRDGSEKVLNGQESVEIRPGDILKFSDSYQFTVG